MQQLTASAPDTSLAALAQVSTRLQVTDHKVQMYLAGMSEHSLRSRLGAKISLPGEAS